LPAGADFGPKGTRRSAGALQSVVVTGASSGIGFGCVKVLAGAGCRVFAGVRKRADADRLRTEFGERARPLIFDVTDRAAVAAAAAEAGAELANGTLAGLVNNAGVAVPGPLLELPEEDFTRQIAVNLTGVFVVTKAFAPLLGADRSRDGRPGRIVMISSVGGRNAPPFLGAYSASKFGLEGLSEALRLELMLFGIDVIVVAPGAVATPIWEKSEDADARFPDTPYGPAIAKVKRYMLSAAGKGLPPERIGETVRTALFAAKPRTRYAVSPSPFQTGLANILPKRFVDRMIARRIGLIP
jgi:NAD(P)-dependent dehydrogenase (short-subunit alcohol dehydrogenase family)